VNGAYVNVPNIGTADWATAYWGSNFDRLRKIKAKYDPSNIFQYEQSIPPATCEGEPPRRPWRHPVRHAPRELA
jgi:hypothetical protein